MTDQNAPANWYPDGSGSSRWWDGTQWTEHVRAAEPQPQFQPQAPVATATATATQTAPAAPKLISDHFSLAILAFGTCALALIGSIGPWAKAGDQSVAGTADGADGVITLICALVAAGTVAATIYLPAGVPRIAAQWATVVLGLAIVIIAIIDISDVNSSSFVSAGWGLWLVALSGAAIAIVGTLLALLRGHQR